MCRCEDCGAEFEDSVMLTVQRAGEPSFDIPVCPYCGSEDYSEMEDCDE